MNYVGHAIVTPRVVAEGYAGDINDDILFGMVAGDWFKDVVRADLPTGVQLGLKLHNQLDTLYDHFPTLTDVRNQLRSNRSIRSLQDPAVDVISDGIIARNFSRLCDDEYGTVIDEIHRVVTPRLHLVPEAQRVIAQQMIREEWLLKYQDEAGIVDALNRIADRIKNETRQERFRDEIPYLIRLGPQIEPLVLEALPYLRAQMLTGITGLGCEAEERLHWRKKPRFEEGERRGVER